MRRETMKNKLTTASTLLKNGLGVVLASLITSSWVLAETKISGEIDLGYQNRNVSSNEAKFEEYGDVPNGAVIPHVDVQSIGDHDQISFEGNNVKENNQSYDLNYNHDYQVKIDASWDQTPHDYSNVGSTLYNQALPGVLTLPTGIKNAFSQAAAPTAATFNNTLSSYTSAGHNAGLRTLDSKSALNLGFRSGEHMRYDLGFSEDKIEGNKPQSYALGSSFPVQLPVPVDWKVWNMHAGTQYASKEAQFGVSYLMSAFNDNVDTLVWDNPKRLTDSATLGAAQGRTALAPDNWSQNIALNGGADLPAKTRVTAKGSMGYMRQNHSLLPFTDNTALLNGAVMKSTTTPAEIDANASMLTWTQDYAVTNRLLKSVTLGARYHSYQLVNQTSEVTMAGRSSWDSSWTAAPSMNNRFEFRKDTLEGHGDWDVVEPLTLGLRYATEWDHRTDREIVDTTEKTLTATMDLKPTRTALLRGTYVHAHRRPQDFTGDGIFEEPAEGGRTTFEELPGLRRFDVSDRLRNQGTALAQWNPGPVMLSFNGSMTHDNFQPGTGDLLEGTTVQAAMYGLLETRDNSLGADMSWDASERVTLNVYYQYEETTNLQRNNTAGLTNTVTNDNVQNPTKDWTMQTVDRYHMAGLSANIGKREERVTYRFAYDITESRGADNFINVGSAVSAATAVPAVVPGLLISPADTRYMKQDVSLKATCRINDKVSVVLGYLYEKFDVSDWQYQNLPLVGGTAASQTNIFLGTNLQNYVAHVGSAVVRYKF
jgi:MtrB/PioB family decaheme-associated outer membrane protein